MAFLSMQNSIKAHLLTCNRNLSLVSFIVPCLYFILLYFFFVFHGIDILEESRQLLCQMSHILDLPNCFMVRFGLHFFCKNIIGKACASHHIHIRRPVMPLCLIVDGNDHLVQVVLAGFLQCKGVLPFIINKQSVG